MGKVGKVGESGGKWGKVEESERKWESRGDKSRIFNLNLEGAKTAW